jgi:adenosylmethionine-8-amino-7-oxononanoate aminotransferase
MHKDKATCDCDCIIPLEELLKEKSGIISAIIMEPMVMAAGGMIVYPKEYLSRAAKLAKKFNVHLILDEVATGFGRTGKMFACEHVNNIEPDFLCISKGLTAGYLPLAATLTTEKIYKAFYADYGENKTFYHGHTYTANPLGCSAALASLEVFKKERTLDRIKEIIPLFRTDMEKFRYLPLVGNVRYIGLIGAVELVKDKLTKEGFSFREGIGLEVYKRALERNLILRPLGNIIYLFLPLCIKRNELQDIMNRTYTVIKSLS